MHGEGRFTWVVFMEGLLFALATVISTALLRISFKYCATNGKSPWTTLILYHIGGALVLLPFLGVPSLAQLSQQQLLLLLTTGVLFALAAFLDILAMKHIDASSGEIFHTLTFIISVAAGFLMFHESCSLSKVIGTLIIAVGILYEARQSIFTTSHAFFYKMGSAALIATSMVITKQLTATTPSEVIILSGFIVPGALYMLIGWRTILEIPGVVRSSNGILLAVPILDALSYTFAIKALTIGEMSTTYMIFQTTISAVFVIEVILNGWQRETYLRRAVSAGLCMFGAILALVA